MSAGLTCSIAGPRGAPGSGPPADSPPGAARLLPVWGLVARPAAPATFVLMFEPADVLDGLNDDQRRAATHQSGPLLVLAGAGTGKTRTLVARAGWLRSQGTPASRILLLTFTRRAADDMLARVTPRGASAADRVVGGTFHAVAHQIIRAHAESFSLPPEFSVIDPPDVTNLMDTLRAENGLVGSQRRAPRAAPAPTSTPGA